MQLLKRIDISISMSTSLLLLIFHMEWFLNFVRESKSFFIVIIGPKYKHNN